MTNSADNMRLVFELGEHASIVAGEAISRVAHTAPEAVDAILVSLIALHTLSTKLRILREAEPRYAAIFDFLDENIDKAAVQAKVAEYRGNLAANQH